LFTGDKQEQPRALGMEGKCLNGDKQEQPRALGMEGKCLQERNKYSHIP